MTSIVVSCATIVVATTKGFVVGRFVSSGMAFGVVVSSPFVFSLPRRILGTRGNVGINGVDGLGIAPAKKVVVVVVLGIQWDRSASVNGIDTFCICNILHTIRSNPRYLDDATIHIACSTSGFNRREVVLAVAVAGVVSFTSTVIVVIH